MSSVTFVLKSMQSVMTDDALEGAAVRCVVVVAAHHAGGHMCKVSVKDMQSIADMSCGVLHASVEVRYQCSDLKLLFIY